MSRTFLLVAIGCILELVGCPYNVGKYRFLLNSTNHNNPQKDKFGVYSSIGVYGRRPKYSRVNSQGAEEYAFYLEKQGRGLWIVAPSLGQENGWLTVRYLYLRISE